MMDNLFGGLVGSNKTQLAGIGADPTKIGDMGRSLTRIKAKMVLPTEISAQQVLKQAEEMGRMDAEVELAKDITDYQSKQLDKLLELHKINVGFTQKTMQVDQALRTIEAGHGKVVSKYHLGAAETQVNLDGYQQIYTVQATEIFG